MLLLREEQKLHNLPLLLNGIEFQQEVGILFTLSPLQALHKNLEEEEQEQVVIVKN
jgi:hypothetical protein